MKLEKELEKELENLKRKNEEVLSNLEKKYQNEKLNREKQILAEISKLAKSNETKKDGDIIDKDREINASLLEFYQRI